MTKGGYGYCTFTGVTKAEEKAKVLNALFASVFNSCSGGVQPQVEKTEMGSRMNPPQSEGQWPPAPLRHAQVPGAGWDSCWKSSLSPCPSLHSILASWEGAPWLAVSSSGAHVQEGWKEHLESYKSFVRGIFYEVVKIFCVIPVLFFLQ